MRAGTARSEGRREEWHQVTRCLHLCGGVGAPCMCVRMCICTCMCYIYVHHAVEGPFELQVDEGVRTRGAVSRMRRALWIASHAQEWHARN